MLDLLPDGSTCWTWCLAGLQDLYSLTNIYWVYRTYSLTSSQQSGSQYSGSDGSAPHPWIRWICIVTCLLCHIRNPTIELHCCCRGRGRGRGTALAGRLRLLTSTWTPAPLIFLAVGRAQQLHFPQECTDQG